MKIVENKNRIRESASKLILQYGIISVSMDDIARLLGMSKKTLYTFYKSKDELVLDVLENLIDRNQEYCTLASISSKNAVEELFQSLEIHDRIFQPLHPSLIFDLKKHHQNAYGCVECFKNEFLIEKIEANILRGIEEGLYRPEINIDITARLRLESIFLPFSNEYFLRKYTIREVQKEIMVHFLYGLATDKGHKLINKYLKKDKEIKK